MRRLCLIAVFFLLALSFQAMWPHFPSSSCRLEVPLLLLFYLCFTASFLEGGIEVLVFGFLLEAWSAPMAGLLSLSYMVVFLAVKILENHLLLEGVFIKGLWAVLLFLFQKGLLFLLLPGKVLFHSPVLLVIQSFLHGLVFMGLFALVSRVEERFRERSA